MDTVLTLLQEELTGYTHAKVKSTISYSQMNIDKDTYNRHMKNLNKLINEFRKAIEILKNS